MKTQGEYLFNTFEEALSFVCSPTNYEKSNGISVTNREIIINAGDLKVVQTTTTDARKGLIIFFKNSTKFDIWKFWIPSQEQQYLFPALAEIFINIDKVNEKCLEHTMTK